MNVDIFTDGGARGNPGPAGAGAVIYDRKTKEVLAEISKYVGETTNNQAEYLAIIYGLEKAKKLKAKDVHVYLDSQLAEKQLKGEYKVKNQELAKRFLEVKNLIHSFDSVNFTHVRREKNKEADALVNKAIDKELAK